MDDYWDVGKAQLQDPTKFLESLFKYDKVRTQCALFYIIAYNSKQDIRWGYILRKLSSVFSTWVPL